MIFSDVFPLVQNADLLPAAKWGKPLSPPYVPAEGECYGVATGTRNGVWVLDVDRKNGKDGLAALQAHMLEHDCEDLPDTYTVATRSGGLHLYFALPEERMGNRTGILSGVDVRGEGGYVRAGGPYRVVCDVAPAQAPAWLIALARAKTADPSISAIAISPAHKDWDARIQRAAAYLKTAEVCTSGVNGQKNIWLVSLMLSRTLELPVATSLQLIQGYNARCVPPWDEADWARTLQRAAEHGTTIPGTFSEGSAFLADAPDAPVTVQATASSEWRQRINPDHKYTWDLAVDVAGSLACAPLSQRDLTASLTGPGANPEWRGVFAFNEFTQRVEAVNPPLKLDAETSGLTVTDLGNIKMWYACAVGASFKTQMLEEAIRSAASAAAYHPIRDYLESLDPKSAGEADAYFTGIAGRLWGAPADRDAVESAALRRFAVAAVRRVTRPGQFIGPDGRPHMRGPGTKVDTMLVLTGPQGWRKSRFCALLFGEYFRDQMPPLEGKDASIALEGFWGVELAEMTAFHRTSEAVKKEFLARCEDKYRPHYERGTVVRKRQVVFIGTTNEHAFLTDPTGARRYDVCEIRRAIALEQIDRDVFWAMADALERAGELHWRDVHSEDPTAKSAGDAGERHSVEDPWASAVLRFVDSKAGQLVSPQDALTYGVLMPLEKQDHRALARVAAILRHHCGPARTEWVGGRAQHMFAATG